MFCAKCGGAIPEGGGFCARCGAAARPITTPDGRLKRPGVVTLLAVLQFIGGGIWLAIGIVGIVLSRTSPPPNPDPTALIIFGLILAGSALTLACGVGLWKLRPFGRQLQIFFACVGLLGIPLGTVISVLILIYMFKPGIKLLFSGKPVESLTADEQAAVAAATASSGVVTVLIAVVALLVGVFVVGVIAAIAIPGLLRARQSGNEAVAIGQLRAFSSAETSYATGNRMLFDREECLLRPSDCVPGYSGPPFLQERLREKSGYRFVFHPGLAPAALPDGASPSSLTSYALMATPISNATGSRQFCVDQTGDVRSAPLTAELSSDSSSCPAHWVSVR